MNYDNLKLENQLCFPLYACSRKIIKLYTPFLEPLGITYTQYITLMVLWESKQETVKSLGEKLFLDSGTLTPLLKKLEEIGLIKRERSKDDERAVIISITDEGMALREKAVEIPKMISDCIDLPFGDAKALHRLLTIILNQ